ncbi:MAG: amidohydrolase [Clostridia bacterium]|nr:amidohydrolase [Clostridia bacterium]
MKILIKNATLVSMSEEREKIENNIDILIDDNIISKIGNNLSNENIEKVIDATGKVVLPGLINAHCHAPMSIFRETVDGYDLQAWLHEKIWPMEDQLVEEDIYWASCLSFLEMIETGCTTMNDMYFMTDDIIKAALDTGIRLQTTRTQAEHEDGKGQEKRISELKDIIEKYNNKYENITLNMGIHGLYTINTDYIRECMKIAKKENLNIHMHFCENSKEIEDIKNIYGKLPIEVLEEEFNTNKVLLAHCVKLSNEEIERIAKMGNVSIVHCPVSNLKLGCGVANISKMLNNGINVALGTDGQGSGSSLDMFEEMKFAALLQKGINEDAMLIPAYEVLKMATINGAKALDLESEIGSIDIGKKADIIILNLENIVLQPINDVVSDIVYNAKGTNVETTIINGKILMENKKININTKEITKNCKAIIDRIS